LPPFVIWGVEKIAFRTSHFLGMLQYRLAGPEPATATARSGNLMEVISALTPMQFSARRVCGQGWRSPRYSSPQRCGCGGTANQSDSPKMEGAGQRSTANRSCVPLRGTHKSNKENIR